MNKDDGGPAFPMGYHRDGNSADHSGMTLRDYFAGMALQGFVSAHNHQGDWTCGHPNNVASAAYDLANAMLKERSK